MDRRLMISLLIALLAHFSLILADSDEDIPHNEVRNWALKFGVDLWEYGRQFTKMNEIRNKYKDLDGEVIRKNGIILLRELTAEVKNFMDFKMNAVLRVMETAEQASLSESERDSAHHHHQAQSQMSHRLYETKHQNDYMSDDIKDMPPKPMRRFEKLVVNLTHSSVLVPSDVSLNDAIVQSSVTWSTHLDPIFVNNLERDAAVSWQYFGSTTGFIRRFPGTQWPHSSSTEKKSINDFRTQDWFIQAASSPKDIMILLDASGSMSGKSFELAITTVSAVLDTLSDNDFVNLIAFSDKTRSVVPCFKDKMVRAYADNIKEMKDAIRAIKCENVANFTSGFEYAFEILHRYNQSSQGSQCNQAIMLITDGTTETHTEGPTKNRENRRENDRIPHGWYFTGVEKIDDFENGASLESIYSALQNGICRFFFTKR